MHGRVLATAALLWSGALGPLPAAHDSAHETCGGCHLPSFGGEAADGPRQVARVCTSCHETRTLAADRAHGQLACSDCHAGHPNGRPYQIRDDRDASGQHGNLDPISRLCVACHGDAADTRAPAGHYVRHPVGVGVTTGALPRQRQGQGQEPIRLPLADLGGTDALADDGIACFTCHAIHFSRGPFLLRWTGPETPLACCQCHDTCESTEHGPLAAPASLEEFIRSSRQAVDRASGGPSARAPHRP